MKKYEIESFLHYMDESPTCFHAVENIKRLLITAGALELEEKNIFCPKPGKTYLVTRNGSALIAFHMPENPDGERIKGFRIYAAHSDSPCFKVKPKGVMKAEDTYVMLNTEKYGGMILSTWLDRPLSIAGRVVFEQDEKLVTKTVNLEELTCVIPNVAIHMNREMNKGVEYNPQTDMRPLLGLADSAPELERLIAEKLGIEQDTILGEDLYVYAKDHCRLMGINKELVGGPRLDDLECVYAGTEGFLAAMDAWNSGEAEMSQGMIPVLAVFDNEEVGSGTKQGADSTFLTDVLERIGIALKFHQEKMKCIYADSFMISADNAHALHPNHPEKADSTNRPVINGGIVVKYHGGQKYTTDAYSEAKLRQIGKKAGLSFQTYANRSDIGGGSTLGNISTAHLSIPTVDIGLPQLAMHSAFETAGTKDYYDLCKLAETYFLCDR